MACSQPTKGEKVLPKRAVDQVKGLGSLNQFTGQLKINKIVKEILQSYKVWNDFDLQIKNNSYKKSTPATK